MYYILIQNGDVFDGTLDQFRKKFFTFPAIWTDEEIISNIKDWAESNGWTSEFPTIN
jgi:hypothetical protein